MKKLHAYLSEHLPAVGIVFILALGVFGGLVKWGVELRAEEKKLFDKELSLEKIALNLRYKGELLEKELINIEQEKIEIQNSKKQLQQTFKQDKNISDINSKRKTLIGYVDKYIEKYSEVDFSRRLGCDEDRIKLKNQAETVLDAISSLANQHRKEFMNFIDFVDRRSGGMVWVESLNECSKKDKT
jgi:hypothetical protein